MTDDTPPIKVGIIGTGGIAGAHRLGYIASGAEVVAVADIDARGLAARSADWKVQRSYADFRDLLADPEVEAVSICLPNALHARAAIAAAEAGKHILCEKPVAVSTAEGEAMIAAADRNGVILTINHQLRSSGAALKAKRLLETGALGELAFVRLRQAHDWGGLAPRASFATRASAGGGTLLDNGCHLFDLARFFGGTVEEIFTHSATRKYAIELEDTAHVSLRFDTGALGSIEAAWTATGWEEGFWIYGTEGAVEFTNRSGRPVLRHAYRESPWTTWGDTDVSHTDFAEASRSAHSRHVQAFLAAVAGTGPNPCTGSDGLEALRLVLAAYQSADSGLPVAVREAEGSLVSS